MRNLVHKVLWFHWWFSGCSMYILKTAPTLSILWDNYIFLVPEWHVFFQYPSPQSIFEEIESERGRDGGKSSLPSELIPVITLLPLNKPELLLREGNS